ncbi:hypothetical protein KC878_00015 [Candidatus Saccharibacteria bacterium]|nr:hypothetical protein [Candidatus Saccharibacteria bacterium]MCB9821558.1 hypothetical protein [Candidatus Nomurabacteria bacterium]
MAETLTPAMEVVRDRMARFKTLMDRLENVCRSGSLDALGKVSENLAQVLARAIIEESQHGKLSTTVEVAEVEFVSEVWTQHKQLGLALDNQFLPDKARTLLTPIHATAETALNYVPARLHVRDLTILGQAELEYLSVASFSRHLEPIRATAKDLGYYRNFIPRMRLYGVLTMPDETRPENYARGVRFAEVLRVSRAAQEDGLPMAA